MQRVRHHRRLTGSFVLAAALALAACGDDDGDSATEATSADTADAIASGSGASGSTTRDTASAATDPPGSSAPSSSEPATTVARSTTAETADAVTATTVALSSDLTSAGTMDDDTTGSTAAEVTDVSAASTTTTAVEATETTHTVVEGDTLFGIAAEAGVTVDALIEANGWEDGVDHVIIPGDVVVLPGGSVDFLSAAVSAEDLLELDLTDGVSMPITEPLADGVYYALDAAPNADTTAVTLTLAQFETTEACEDRMTQTTATADEIDATCVGYHLVESPSATLDV
ncbi:MAG: LysM peptidoglycan-binding domain-containing protein, partial [Desertimonas sp.]